MKTMISSDHTSPDENRKMAGWTRKILTGEKSFFEHLSADDWNRFIDFARNHGIAPVLYHALKDSRPGSLSDNSLQELRNIYFRSAKRNMLLYHELGKVLRALREAGIPVILLKGACLAEAVYGNIALRSMGDVDLLVKKEDMARAEQILSSLGYSAGYDFLIEDEKASCHHLPPLVGLKKLSVEVHWNIVDFAHFAVLEENEIGNIWRRARPVVIAEAPVFMLSPEDLLLHLCLHLSLQHLFDMRLRGFLDLKKVIECYGDAIDWESLRERAHRWGVDRAVCLTLYFAEQWVGLNLPERLKHEWILKRIDPDLLNWIEAKVLGEALPYTGKSNLTELITRRGIPAKVRILWKRFFLPPAMLSRQLKIDTNSWKVYLYYPVGWLSLFKRCGPTVWSALRGDAAVKTHAQRESALRQWLGEA